MPSYCCRFCKFSTAGKTAPGVKMKLEPQKGSEDGCGGTVGVGRREVCGFGRNIFMGYLNRDNDTKVNVVTDLHFLHCVSTIITQCHLCNIKGNF